VTGQPHRRIDRDFAQTVDRVRGLDRDLALAVAYDGDAHLALTPARDVGRALTGALDRAQDIVRARAAAVCLTFDRDPQLALTRARDTARTADGDVAVADSADLLAVLLYFLEALRPPHRDQSTAVAGQQRVHRPARRLALMSAGLLPAAYRWRYIAEYSAQMAELPRREQLGYALRAAGRTWPLRRALISSAQHAPAPNQ
jgi:hypothetical protein